MHKSRIKALGYEALILTLGLGTVTPAWAAFSADIQTQVTINRSSYMPAITATWQMNASRDAEDKYFGTDDLSNTGPQFLPSGQFQTDKSIAVCAVVTDPNGLDDIATVNALLSNPSNAAPASGATACPEPYASPALVRLSPSDGLDLLCNRIKNWNNNLPTFGASLDYANFCAADGTLALGTAAVYCGEAHLSYDTVSGDHRVSIDVADQNSHLTSLEQNFRYEQITAFENDFSAINYGSIDIQKDVSLLGDDVFGPASGASLRNIGNSRLAIKVAQDDMGFGLSDGTYNVIFGSRLTAEPDFTIYLPQEEASLASSLDLGKTRGIDYSIRVNALPIIDNPIHTGSMTLSATALEHYVCQP